MNLLNQTVCDVFCPGTRYTVNYDARNALSRLQKSANDKIRAYIAEQYPDNKCTPLGPVATGLRTSTAPKQSSDILGVTGVALFPGAGPHVTFEVKAETGLECSHQCHVSSACIGFSWIGHDSSKMSKAFWSIFHAKKTQNPSKCFLFDISSAPLVLSGAYNANAMSGIKIGMSDHFSSRVKALIQMMDPLETNELSSKAIRVSFGGGTVDGWQIDSGHAAPASNVGQFGWSCDLQSDVRHRKKPSTEASDLFFNNQIMSRHDQCKNPSWVLHLNNGLYRVLIGYSDPESSLDSKQCKINGHAANDGLHASGNAFQFQSVVSVSNSQLVFSGSYSKGCSSIAYIVVDEVTHYLT